MKTVLCPTDFSHHAKRALEFAVETALHLDAELVIFHCYHSFFPGSGGVPVPEEKMREEDLEKLQAVRKVALQLAGDRSLNVRIESRPGLAADAIVDYSNTLQADLIVMGTKGASGLEETLLGTVTTNVINNSDVPVLAIPDNAKFRNFHSIAYAIDYKKENAEIVQQLLKFARAFDAHITALHVYDKDEVVNIPKIEQLSETNPVLFGYPKISFQTEIYDDVEDGIEAFSQREQPSILAVLSRERGFFEALFHTSITKKLLCHSDIPVLAFHE